jgi:hypothetical protein
MAISREERITRKYSHTKQEKLQVKNGLPEVSQMREGVPILRSTNEGVVQYIRYNGVLYKNVMKNALASLDVSRFADDGYIKFGNGLIMQWGQETAAATTETVTFPIPFPTVCLNVVATAYRSSVTGGLTNAVGINTLPTTTTVIFNTNSAWDTIFWQAIGH